MTKKLCIVAVFITIYAGQASAANVDQLVRILSSVYLLHNLTSVCAAQDRKFLEETSGSRGTMAFYSQHVKEEVIDGLLESEAYGILRRAADAAKSTALMAVRGLAAPSPDVERRRLQAWCESSVKLLVRQYVADHDLHHESFERDLLNAKSP